MKQAIDSITTTTSFDPLVGEFGIIIIKRSERMRFVMVVSSISIMKITFVTLVLLLSVTWIDCFSGGLLVLPRNTCTSQLKLSPQQLGTFEKLPIRDSSSRKVRLFDWINLDPVDFDDGWKFQKELMSNHLERLVENQGESVDSNHQFEGFDSIILLQHLPVFTLGTGSNAGFVLNDSIPVVRMDRGGEVTYHGPGQLVVYPIIDLRGYKQDIHWYMRALEETILLALRKAGIRNAVRENDVTGVWIDHRKVAALGIKARRWITQHGLAINVTPETLENFRGIIPCGLEGREVTCVNDHLTRPVSVSDFSEFVKEALEEVFCIQLLEEVSSS